MWYNGTENPSKPIAAPARKIIPHLNTFYQEVFEKFLHKKISCFSCNLHKYKTIARDKKQAYNLIIKVKEMNTK